MRLGPPARLEKLKRPAGVYEFDVVVDSDGGDHAWLWYPADSPWRAPNDQGAMWCDAVLLVSVEPPSVTWWIDDRDDPRISIDVCLPPVRTSAGWSFVDLELDPVRHERSGLVEVQDRDELEEFQQCGVISPDEAAFATERARELEAALVDRVEPWGDVGWDRLRRLQR